MNDKSECMPVEMQKKIIRLHLVPEIVIVDGLFKIVKNIYRFDIKIKINSKRKRRNV